MADFAAAQPAGTLLIVLPLPVHQRGGRTFIESQAANGLAQWLLHFAAVTLVVKLAPGDPPAGSVAIDTLGLSDRLDVVLAPLGWSPPSHFRALSRMRRTLAELIDRHDYLHFALGGAWGDWAAEGALIAAKRGRKASVWTDRVESEVMRIDALRRRGLSRWVHLAYARLARRLERRAIRTSALGLFHGNDTFEAYRTLSPRPHLVHDIHLKPADRISEERLAAKTLTTAEGPLDIIYVGRVHPDKGVMDWVESLRNVAQAGVPFRARWFGEGPQREEAIAKVAALGLSSDVEFPGPLIDRAELLEHLRNAHLMLFCHLTPESPRCLIEALVSGTPIIGYDSAYPADLILGHGGGVLTPMEPAALAEELIRLSGDRDAIADLIGRAAKDGYPMNDEAVFTHRAQLIKLHS